MICPKCEVEYVEGITKCYDCGSELVSVKDFHGNLVHPEDYVILYTTDENYEANMLKANLESADLDVIILGQKDRSLPTVGNLSVIKIFVNKKDYQDAFEILNDINSKKE